MHSSSLYVHVHLSARHIYTSWTLWCTLAPYISPFLFTFVFLTIIYKFLSAYAMLHISFCIHLTRFSRHRQKSLRHRNSSRQPPLHTSCNIDLWQVVSAPCRHWNDISSWRFRGDYLHGTTQNDGRYPIYVCKLKKLLYGLQKSLTQWYSKLHKSC